MRTEPHTKEILDLVKSWIRLTDKKHVESCLRKAGISNTLAYRLVSETYEATSMNHQSRKKFLRAYTKDVS